MVHAEKQLGNHLLVTSFAADFDDQQLFRLVPFLIQLSQAGDFSNVRTKFIEFQNQYYCKIDRNIQDNQESDYEDCNFQSIDEIGQFNSARECSKPELFNLLKLKAD